VLELGLGIGGTLPQNVSFVNHHSAIEIVSFVNGNSINGNPF